MWRITLLILAISGVHAVPLDHGAFGVLPPKNALPVEFRRQGTEPSRRQLVDLNTGLLMEHVSEMQRRVGGFYVRPATNQFRQGTQNSQAVLVDILTGQVKSPIGEMQRAYRSAYAPPHQGQFRQGTQNSHATLVNQRTGKMVAPAMEMERNVILRDERGEEQVATVGRKCSGDVISSRCYLFIATQQTFTEAESTCRQVSPNGDLASVTSADLHSRLAGIVIKANNGPTHTWLGGVIQDNKLQWTDGSPWSYADWMPGQPKTETDEKQCLEMFKIGERWWSAADCGSKRAFICSYPVIQ